MDDHDVGYQSLKMNGKSSEGYNFNDMVPSDDALEAQRLRKMYNQFRRQASGASNDSTHSHAIHSPQHQRLDSWLEDLEAKRRSEKKYVTFLEFHTLKSIIYRLKNKIRINSLGKHEKCRLVKFDSSIVTYK